MAAINKAFATRAELEQWNTAIDNMHRGIFAPEIHEMIDAAEQENARRHTPARWAPRKPFYPGVTESEGRQ